MKSIKNFENKTIEKATESLAGGKGPRLNFRPGTTTGDDCIGHDRRLDKGGSITNTHDWNPFNND